MVADELPRADRTWWRAVLPDGATVGYAGGLIVGGDVQVLKVAVDPDHRRAGIARQLLARVLEDARNLGAATASLEVRASNAPAIAFYEAHGFCSLGQRPHYYSDGEDALILSAAVEAVAAASSGKPCSDAPANMLGEGCVAPGQSSMSSAASSAGLREGAVEHARSQIGRASCRERV